MLHFWGVEIRHNFNWWAKCSSNTNILTSMEKFTTPVSVGHHLTSLTKIFCLTALVPWLQTKVCRKYLTSTELSPQFGEKNPASPVLLKLISRFFCFAVRRLECVWSCHEFSWPEKLSWIVKLRLPRIRTNVYQSTREASSEAENSTRYCIRPDFVEKHQNSARSSFWNECQHILALC